MNLTTFFAYARRAPFGGKLTTAQVAGCKRLLKACEANSVTDRRQVSCMLANVFRETGGRMQPVRETFATSDAQAIARLDKAWAAGKLPQVSKPYWRSGWFGRGDIQVTHQVNYRRAFDAIGLPPGTSPARALEPEISARMAVVGMRDGLFTGRKLDDYFNAEGANPVGSRAIVNGTDKAKLIAGYYRNFLDAIEAAEAASWDAPEDVEPSDAEPDDVPASRSGSVGTVAVTTGAGAASALVAGISNPWAFGAFALILFAGCVGAWLLLTGRVTINRSKAA